MSEFLINFLIVLGMVTVFMAVAVALTRGFSSLQMWMERRLGKQVAGYISFGLFTLLLCVAVAAILTWAE